MDAAKSNVMVDCSGGKIIENAVKWPCGVVVFTMDGMG